MSNIYFMVGDLVYVKRKDWEIGKVVGIINHKNFFRGEYQTYLIESRFTYHSEITEHNAKDLVLRHD